MNGSTLRRSRLCFGTGTRLIGYRRETKKLDGTSPPICASPAGDELRYRNASQSKVSRSRARIAARSCRGKTGTAYMYMDKTGRSRARPTT